MAHARMFTIAPGLSFLDELAQAVLDDKLGLGLDPAQPLGLAKTTIYLPTRRAASAFSGIMSREIRHRTGQKAALLPRILPLGGLDEAEVDLLAAASPHEPALPPAILGLRRRMLLARQIEAWGRSVNRSILGLDGAHFRLIPDRLGEAVALAAPLADLIDTLHNANVPFARLASLDVSNFDHLWDFTHEFLKIAGEWWPLILSAEGTLDPADRRNKLIDAECARIKAGRMEGPVIAAGSTGSVPATARLLSAIAASPKGAVVLPGVDPWLDDASWSTLTSTVKTSHDGAVSHPQAVLARLMDSMKLARSEIINLGQASRVMQARALLASEALRPAETTHLWQLAKAHLTADVCANALEGVTLIEALDEREEALAIALVLREALENPETHATLVTADRGLAERVAVELARWSIVVDDSAGKPLSRSPQGHLAVLVLELVTDGLASPTLVALLAHPLLSLGMTDVERQSAASALEIAVLRGGRNRAKAEKDHPQSRHEEWNELQILLADLALAPDRISHHHAAGPLRRIGVEGLALAQVLLQRLGQALMPLQAISTQPEHDMASVAVVHADVLARLTAQGSHQNSDQINEDVQDEQSDDDQNQSSSTPAFSSIPAIFRGPAGASLEALLSGLAITGQGLLKGDISDYADMVTVLMQGEVVAPKPQVHARITILGLLEARLLETDLMVLGGLNEGVWPPEAANDPFLNRSMRQELGLPVPERRIGQSAHDFTQGFAAAKVVLARAAKAGLTQTVPSRFWQRLQAVSPPHLWAEAQQRGLDVLAQARHVGQPEKVVAARRPEPRPPVALQPTQFSVTEIETLYRDPYAVYARRVLKLDKLEPLERDLDARERGTLLHEIIGRFAQAWCVALPPDAMEQLMQTGRDAFEPLIHQPDVSAFWWPRFERLAGNYIGWEVSRRAEIATLATEKRSSLELSLSDGTPIKLTAKADRIELLHDGRFALIDFKSSSTPGLKEISNGLAAQLTLQAAMASQNGFGAFAATSVASFAYVSLKSVDAGGLKSVGKTQEKDNIAEMAQQHLSRLGGLLMDYRTGKRGFISRAMPKSIRVEGDYDMLARVKEWSRFAGSGSDAGDEEGGEP